jgi:hypothetical protein
MAAVLDLVRSRMGGLQHEHCISRISGSTGVWELVKFQLLYFLLLFLPVNILMKIIRSVKKPVVIPISNRLGPSQNSGVDK